MKTICAMRDVFKAMGNFETAFEKMYQITLNEAMILCALKEASEKVTATNLSKQTELSPSHTSKMLRILEEKGLIVRSARKRRPETDVLPPDPYRQAASK